MALVNFYRGLREFFNEEAHADGIYFATDTKEIVVNGTAYGYNPENHQEVESVDYTAPDTIVFTYTNGETDTITLQAAQAGESAEASKAGIISKEDIYKLSKIEENAEVNIIETVKVNGVPLSPDGSRAVNVDLTDIQNSINKQKVTAADSSMTVTEGAEGTTVQVKVNPTGSINVTESGLAVDQAALVEYVGDSKAIEVDSSVNGSNQKKVSLKLNSKQGNILTSTADGLFATVQLKKLTVGSDSPTVAARYGLVGVQSDGTEISVGDVTIDILNDKYLEDVELGVIPTGQPNSGNDAFIFTFKDASGTAQTKYVDVSSFLRESEAGNGILISKDSSSVTRYSIKIDAVNSEKNPSAVSYLQVDENGLKIVGLNQELNTLKNQAAAAKTEVQAKADGHVKVAVTSETDGHSKVVITESDIASASDLEQEVQNRTSAITTLQNYVNTEVAKKQDKFSVGTGLALEDGTLKVTIDHTLFKVVTTLPDSPDSGDENKIFLVPSTETDTQNSYKEYIYTGSVWEQLGEFKSEIDLTPYLKKTDLTASVSTTGLYISKDAGTGKLVEIGLSEDLPGTVSGTKVTIALKDVLTTSVASGMYKVAVDKKGRITGTAAITLNDLVSLGVATKSELESVKSDLAELSTAQAEGLSKITSLESKLNGIDNVQAELNKKANADSVYDKDYIDRNYLTSTQSDAKYQPVGNYATKEELEKESQDRTSADTAIEAKITSEATTRQTEDGKLSARIDTVEELIEEVSDQYVKKTGDTISGQLTSTVATGTAPFKVASTTKVDNLNADLIDGYHVGNRVNTIPVNVKFPPASELRLEYPYTGNLNKPYYKALLKWVCKQYPNSTNLRLTGVGNPNSLQTVDLVVYNTSEVDNEGLPRYSYGLAVALESPQNRTSGPCKFSTYEYQYMYENVDGVVEVKTSEIDLEEVPDIDLVTTLILRYFGVVKGVDTYLNKLSENQAIIPLSDESSESGIAPIADLNDYIGTPNNWLTIYVPHYYLIDYIKTYPTYAHLFAPISGRSGSVAKLRTLAIGSVYAGGGPSSVDLDTDMNGGGIISNDNVRDYFKNGPSELNKHIFGGAINFNSREDGIDDLELAWSVPQTTDNDDTIHCRTRNSLGWKPWKKFLFEGDKINADTLNGYKTGLITGTIPTIIRLPSYVIIETEITSLGGTLDISPNSRANYFKLVSKYIVLKYPNIQEGNCIALSCSQLGNGLTLLNFLNSTTYPLDSNGYPKYIQGITYVWGGTTIYWGFRNNVWYYYELSQEKLQGIITKNGLSPIYLSYKTNIVNATQGGTIQVESSTVMNGETQVIINNTGSSDITIAIPTTFKSNGLESITIAPGNYGEINIIYDGTNYYLRAI